VIPVEKVPQERKTQESGGFLQEYAPRYQAFNINSFGIHYQQQYG